MIRQNRFLFVVLMLLTGIVPARADRPVGLLLGGAAAQKKSPGDERWQALERGAEIFAGDSVKAAGGDIKLAFCPDAPAKDRGRYYVLEAGGAVHFSATGINAQAGSLGKPVQLAICAFPQISRTHLASTQDFSTVPLPEPSAALTREQRDQLDLAESMAADPDLWIVSKMTRAVLLEQFNRPQQSIAEYRDIRDAAPEATWTRDPISRIGSASLPSAPSAANTLVPRGASVPELPADLAPRTSPAGASGLVDTLPDYSKGQTYALLIGVAHYPPDKNVTPLNFAGHDAETFRKYLQKDRGGHLPDDHIWCLTDQNATRDKIEKAITEFVQGKKADKDRPNTLIVFVAAHGKYVCLDQPPGSPSCNGREEPFILVRDGDTEAPNISGYSMRRLRELVTERTAEFGRVLLFVDVCHGGNVLNSTSLSSKNLLEAVNSGDRHLGIMTGSSVYNKGRRGQEYAYESRQLQHGVFTYFLLRGMNGDVKAVQNKITFDSLHRYVSGSVFDFTQAAGQAAGQPAGQVPNRDTTDPMLPVVDDASKEPFILNQIDPNPQPLAPMSADAPAEEEQNFEAQLKIGHLLEPGGAGDALESIRTRYGNTFPAYLHARDQYRVALEDQGQQTVVKYLEGDQNQQDKSEFQTCDRLFGAALKLAPDADFDESRQLFCRARALLYPPQPGRPYSPILSQTDFKAAVQMLERSIRIDPRRSYSYNALGIAYLEQADFDRAIEAFHAAIRFAPYWAYPRHNLALALTEKGNYQPAAAEYRAAMDLGPNYSYLPYNLGLLYQQIADFPQAKTYYRKAADVATRRCELRLGHGFKRCPERAAPQSGLASLETMKGKKSKALKLFDAALNDDPADLTAAHDKAALLSGWRGKDWREKQVAAETIWKANLKRQPEHLPSLIGYSDLLSRECRFGDAVPLYRSILKQIADYVPAQIGLARALVGTRALAEAGPMTDALIKDRATNAQAWAARAEFLDSSSGASEAAWQNALKLARDSGERKQIVTRRNATGCIPTPAP